MLPTLCEATPSSDQHFGRRFVDANLHAGRKQQARQRIDGDANGHQCLQVSRVISPWYEQFLARLPVLDLAQNRDRV